MFPDTFYMLDCYFVITIFTKFAIQLLCLLDRWFGIACFVVLCVTYGNNLTVTFLLLYVSLWRFIQYVTITYLFNIVTFCWWHSNYVMFGSFELPTEITLKNSQFSDTLVRRLVTSSNHNAYELLQTTRKLVNRF